MRHSKYRGCHERRPSTTESRIRRNIEGCLGMTGSMPKRSWDCKHVVEYQHKLREDLSLQTFSCGAGVLRLGWGVLHFATLQCTKKCSATRRVQAPSPKLCHVTMDIQEGREQKFLPKYDSKENVEGSRNLILYYIEMSGEVKWVEIQELQSFKSERFSIVSILVSDMEHLCAQTEVKKLVGQALQTTGQGLRIWLWGVSACLVSTRS